MILALESAALEPARCCLACRITEQGFLARDEMATDICRSGWSLSSCFGPPSSRTSEAARDPNAACNRGRGMLLQIVSLLILSQVALRTGAFELCNRPSNPLSTTSTLCGTIPGPAECAKRLNNDSSNNIIYILYYIYKSPHRQVQDVLDKQHLGS